MDGLPAELPAYLASVVRRYGAGCRHAAFRFGKKRIRSGVTSGSWRRSSKRARGKGGNGPGHFPGNSVWRNNWRNFNPQVVEYTTLPNSEILGSPPVVSEDGGIEHESVKQSADNETIGGLETPGVSSASEANCFWRS